MPRRHDSLLLANTPPAFVCPSHESPNTSPCLGARPFQTFGGNGNFSPRDHFRAVWRRVSVHLLRCLAFRISDIATGGSSLVAWPFYYEQTFAPRKCRVDC